MFTRALHWFLSWARSIFCIPPLSISLRSILILPTYPYLGLPSDLFPSGFPSNILYAFFFSPIHATCSLIILIILGKEYKLWVFSSTLFSNALSLCSSLNVKDHVSHVQKRQNYCFVYSNFYNFSQQARRWKILDWMVSGITWIQSQILFVTISPTWFSWTFLMAYSKAKLKRSGDKASPCFRPFWIGISNFKYLQDGWILERVLIKRYVFAWRQVIWCCCITV
jgi:hypothetical protein